MAPEGLAQVRELELARSAGKSCQIRRVKIRPTKILLRSSLRIAE
jgi:hypothetical protein